VRPWLYRIARNRSLNHLRRASAVGMDSMDVHYADHGLSTGDRVLRRESFRELLADVQQLPETQRTALLPREIDALSYEQIAPARRHVRDCDRCRFFKRQLRENNHALAAVLPVGPLLLIKKLVLAKLGSTASASSAHVASGAGATMGAGAAATAGAAGGAGAG